MRMQRRTFLAGIAASAATSGLAAPAMAQSEASRVLTYVPPQGLQILDPHFTTLNNVSFYGHYVYDMLYSVDANYRARPQMAEGHTVSQDLLTWEIKLRKGLKFHDGEPVRAQDCVASIKRWGQRDGFGAALLSYTDEVVASDDTTIRFRLKKPFGVLPDALAHPVASPCVIMPERIAATPISQQVTETIGSGPLRFVRDEFVPGEHALFEKNPDYVPRQDPNSGLSGGKVIHFDRIQWKALPDASTAAAALQAGEIDWWDTVHFDLLDLLRSDPNLKVEVSDPSLMNFIRFQNGQAPFNNVELRRAVASAVDQTIYTRALVTSGDIQTCAAIYPCRLPGVKELGKELIGGEKDWAAIAEKVKASGYDGTEIVILNATDNVWTAPMGPILLDMCKKIGLNARMDQGDLNTISQRRATNKPLSEGGWSMFAFLASTPVLASPLTAVVARGLGEKGWPGDNDDPELEQRISDWIAAPSDEERLQKLNDVHERLWETVPLVPLASYSQYTGYRGDLTGYIQSVVPIPWGVRRSA